MSPLVFAAILPIIVGASCWPNKTGLRNLLLLEPMNCSHEVVLGAALADTRVHSYLHFSRGLPPGMEFVRRDKTRCLLMQWSTKIHAAVVASRRGNLLLAPLAA